MPGHFALREIASELENNDRIFFLMTILQLSTMLSVRQAPLGRITRVQVLKILESQLRRLNPISRDAMPISGGYSSETRARPIPQ